MDLVQIALLLLAGAVTGFLAGFFGVGGGVILVPVLIAYLQATGVSSLIATHVAFGTSLFIIIFASGSSAWQYSQNRHILWRAVVFMGVGSVLGALGGVLVAGELPGKTLQRIFAVVVVAAAMRLLSEPRRPKGELEPKLAVPGLRGVGFAAGVLSALAGVGGGIVAIPAMYSLLHFPMKKALGTSSATIVITAVASVIGYVLRGWGNPLLPPGTAGYVDMVGAIPVIVGTLPAAALGATVALNTAPAVLRRIFATLLIIIALKMFFF
jgi:uncharacterized membrane protein YfcA